MILKIADIIIAINLFALFTSIIINFAEAGNKKVVKEKKSIIETGTMTLFFFGFYLLIRFRIGAVLITGPVMVVLIVMGLLMIIAGCIINIAGRFNLGANWSNQIRIYDDQTFARNGMFRIIRHPLYASLMLMFYGACLVHPNYWAFIAVTVLFIPFMYYRAKQEEVLLIKTFENYKEYKNEVGMFFPKLMHSHNEQNRRNNQW